MYWLSCTEQYNVNITALMAALIRQRFNYLNASSAITFTSNNNFVLLTIRTNTWHIDILIDSYHLSVLIFILISLFQVKKCVNVPTLANAKPSCQAAVRMREDFMVRLDDR